ncbi:hypothetical protein F5X98DRAFT_389319 [Xylaria grammica]|nr:hypothetical protein F5X98DRAFT_389319 [Xylaria grammica]
MASIDLPTQPNVSSSNEAGAIESVKVIYPPPSSKFDIRVDLVALNAYSEDTDQTWIFHPPPKYKKPTSTIGEQTWDISAPQILFEKFTSFANQPPSQAQQSTDAASSSQQRTDNTRQRPQRSGQYDFQPNFFPLANEDPKSTPSRRTRDESKGVNWLKELLPRSFPSTRIIQCSFRSSRGVDVTAVVSKLFAGLRDERKDFEPILCRPIIFIVHGLTNDDLVNALKEATDLASSTIGVVLFTSNPPTASMEGIVEKNILINYFYGKEKTNVGGSPFIHPFIQEVRLDCTQSDLGKFSSSEDSNYLAVKATITKYIKFATTRRLWDAISDRNETKGKVEARTQITEGADVNRKTSKEQSSLHLAIAAKSLEIVKLLLDNNAEVNAKGNAGRSSVEQAIEANSYEIVRALLERGAIVHDKYKDDVKGDQSVQPRIKSLLDTVTHFAGPRIHQKNGEWSSEASVVNIPEECLNATKQFDATITTFEVRGEKKAENGESEDEREYHITRTIPVFDLLYDKKRNDLLDDALAGRKWRWYHLPVNNMDWVKALFFRLKVSNEDGRLTSREHRGQYPYTFYYLQPKANVLEKDDYKITILFTPYLHFETSEGRARLRNAIQQAMRNRIDMENDSTDVMLAETISVTSKIAKSSADRNDHNDITDNGDDNDDEEYNSELNEHGPKERSRREPLPFKERYKKFRSRLQRFQRILGEGQSKDDRLINAYFAQKDHHLHLRRTLDQFYYTSIESTDERDSNQVLQRYAIKHSPKMGKDEEMSVKLLMVDQLWMWILQGTNDKNNILITSFPQGWCHSKGLNNDSIDLLEQIQSYLRQPSREAITSVSQLASVIVKECTRVSGPFKRPSEPGKPLEPGCFEIFSASISAVSDQLSTMSQKLHDIVLDDETNSTPIQKSKIYDGENNSKKKSKKEKNRKGPESPQFNIAEEVDVLVEVQDIQDELNIIKMVLDDQSSVLTIRQDGGDEQHAGNNENFTTDTFPIVDGKPIDHYSAVNRQTIERMRLRVADTHQWVHHLIDLKQKQANLSEAKYARIEATSAAKEGKTILALTIVNMLFLPLSFLTSFFALEIAEFPKDPESGENSLGLSWVSKYIFGISLAIAVPSIALALAIGPLEGPANRLGRKLMRWGKILLRLFAIILGGLIVVVPLSIYAVFKYGSRYYKRVSERRLPTYQRG